MNDELYSTDSQASLVSAFASSQLQTPDNSLKKRRTNDSPINEYFLVAYLATLVEWFVYT